MIQKCSSVCVQTKGKLAKTLRTIQAIGRLACDQFDHVSFANATMLLTMCVFCLHPRRVHDSRLCSPQAVSSCGLNLQTNHGLATGDFATGNLAVECLGVHAIESLDVRVATNFVKIMKRKKIARNESSNFDSTILILLAMLHWMVFALSFLRNKGICRPCSCRGLARIFVVGPKSFLAFVGPT